MARLPAIRLSSASCSRSSRCGDQRGAAVELIDDLEDRLLPLLRRRLRHQQPADPEMDLGAQCFRDQRIGGLLHPVVDEPVGAFQALDQLLTNRLPQRRVDLLLRGPENDRKHRDLGDVAEAGELLQRLLRFDRQAGQLADHEVHDIVGVTLGVNALEIPAPARRVMIEGEQALFGERVKKLNHEERIAGGLLMHQLRQRRGALRVRSEAHRRSTARGRHGRAAQA